MASALRIPVYAIYEFSHIVKRLHGLFVGHVIVEEVDGDIEVVSLVHVIVGQLAQDGGKVDSWVSRETAWLS